MRRYRYKQWEPYFNGRDVGVSCVLLIVFTCGFARHIFSQACSFFKKRKKQKEKVQYFRDVSVALALVERLCDCGKRAHSIPLPRTQVYRESAVIFNLDFQHMVC